MGRRTPPGAPWVTWVQFTPAIRNRSSAADTQRKDGRVGGVALGTGVVRRPTAAHRGRCALRCVGNVSALQIRCPSSNGRGVEDAAPYGGCDRVSFSGAVRCTDVECVCLSVTVMFHAETFVPQPPVRGGVLDAPRSRDHRGGVGADGRRDRLHPRLPRCAHLASITQRIQSCGRSPRTILYGRSNVVRLPSPGGRGSPPLRWVERYPEFTRIAPTPQSRPCGP